jgi:hypothetical protein
MFGPVLAFIQAGIASGNSGNGRRSTINFGIGHRLLVEDDMAIAGINFFTDYAKILPLMFGPVLASQ